MHSEFVCEGKHRLIMKLRARHFQRLKAVKGLFSSSSLKIILWFLGKTISSTSFYCMTIAGMKWLMVETICMITLSPTSSVL